MPWCRVLDGWSSRGLAWLCIDWLRGLASLCLNSALLIWSWHDLACSVARRGVALLGVPLVSSVSCGLPCPCLPCNSLARSWSMWLNFLPLSSVWFRQVTSRGVVRRRVSSWHHIWVLVAKPRLVKPRHETLSHPRNATPSQDTRRKTTRTITTWLQGTRRNATYRWPSPYRASLRLSLRSLRVLTVTALVVSLHVVQYGVAWLLVLLKIVHRCRSLQISKAVCSYFHSLPVGGGCFLKEGNKECPSSLKIDCSLSRVGSCDC